MGSLFWGLYAAVHAVSEYVRSLNSDLGKALVAAVAAIVGSAITISIGKAYETRAATTKELRSKKAPVYEAIVHGTFSMLFAKMLGTEEPGEQDLKRFFIQTTETLTIWGSNDVVKAFGKFKGGSTDSTQTMFVFEDLLFAIRRDLGHEGKLERATLLRLFITDIDDHMTANALKAKS